jgi:hypothetical protein
MKNQTVLNVIGSLVLGGWMLVQPAQANELLIGVKGGVQEIIFEDEILGNSEEDPAIMVSAQIGYEFLDLAVFDIAAELELATSLTEGEVANRDYNNQSKGLFASARSAGPIYFIGRLGYVDTEIDFTDRANIQDNAIAYGLGVGFSMGIRLELELTQYEYDEIGTGSYLSLGLSF